MKTKTCHRIKHGLSKLEDWTQGLSDEKKKIERQSNDKSKNTYERTFNTKAFDSVVSNMSKDARL